MITIKPLDQNDIPELATLAASTYADTFGKLIPADQIDQTIKETRSKASFYEAFKKDSFLIAKDDLTLIGYIQISDLKYEVNGFDTEEHDQSINALYVHMDHQGKGIGTKLMHAALSHERLTNLQRVFIDVWEKNEKAVSFYLNYGFKEVGKCAFTIDGEIVGYDLVLMKDINQ